MHLVFLFLFLIFFNSIRSQTSDSFEDGDFTSEPTWVGDLTHFEINSNKELQLASSVAGKSELILFGTTPLSNDYEWNLSVSLQFSPSSSNYCRIYLLSSSNTLKQSPDGIYLQLGESGTSDAIRLMEQRNGTVLQIGASEGGLIANPFYGEIQIVYSDSNKWEVFSDISNNGNKRQLFAGKSGLIENMKIMTGIRADYTLSNARKFIFDDVYMGKSIVDTLPPTIERVVISSLNKITLYASKPLDKYQTELTSKYRFTPDAVLKNCRLDTLNSRSIHLEMETDFVNGSNLIIEVIDLYDANLNRNYNQHLTCRILVSEEAMGGDIIITEIMSDPTPVHGLADAEYVEVYNRSDKYILLKNWKIWDEITARTIDSCWIFPKSYLIITDRNNQTHYPNAATVPSFPSLNSDADIVSLSTNSGEIMDLVAYNSNWYRDPSKKSGGWSLERKILDHPCSDKSNWSASNAETGGTPEKQNSIIEPYYQPPSLSIQKTTISTTHSIDIEFNQPVLLSDSLNDLISFTPISTIKTIFIEPSDYSHIQFIFSENISRGVEYEFKINNLKDCLGGINELKGRFVLGFEPDSGDLVINELLFHASSQNCEFVEIYNASDKPIDLYGVAIEKLNPDGENYNDVCTKHLTLGTDQYMVFSDDSSRIINHSQSVGSGTFYNFNLPSLNNDSNTILLRLENQILDRVSYLADWHLPLLDDYENKSLERIQPKGKSNDPNNWHTAATTVGFSTPGLRNSQYISVTEQQHIFSSATPIFSPDNDGYQDLLELNYQLPEYGLIGTVRIYNELGQEIATLVSNDLLPVAGTFIWNGIDAQQRIVPIGNYIIALSAFHPNGRIVQERFAAHCVTKFR